MIETPDQVTNHTKHINIAYHWIWEEVQKQTILPEYVPSDKNLSHTFTKGCYAPHHKWGIAWVWVNSQCFQNG